MWKSESSSSSTSLLPPPTPLPSIPSSTYPLSPPPYSSTSYSSPLPLLFLHHLLLLPSIPSPPPLPPPLFLLHLPSILFPPPPPPPLPPPDSSIMAPHSNVLVSYIQALPSMQQLEVLNFGDCLLRTGGAQLIAEALREGHTNLKVKLLLGLFLFTRHIMLSDINEY